MSDDIRRNINEALSRAFDHSAFLDLDDAAPSTKPMPEFRANKIAMRIDARLLPGWSPDELSPTERAKYDEEMRAFRIEQNKRAFIREGAWAELQLIQEPAVRAVLDLHAMVDKPHGDPECAHCYWDTEMGDHEDWPCETVTAIANAYGIELP